jgi:hypothetical protein
MLFCTAAVCCVRCALGSYVAIFFALVALLQSTLSAVPLALERLALPYKALSIILFASSGLVDSMMIVETAFVSVDLNSRPIIK